MVESSLQVYCGRIMPPFSEEKPCNYGCRYCFAPTLKSEVPTPPTLDVVRRQIEQTLAANGDEINMINSSPTQELFSDEDEGLEHVRFLASFGKHVSFPTKSALSPRAIDELAEVDSTLREHGKRIVMQVSFISGLDRRDLETRTPPVEARIQAVKALIGRDVAVGVYMRPILPASIVPTSELSDLVDRTIGFVRAYTVGGEFMLNEKMARRLGIDLEAEEIAPYLERNISLPFTPSSSNWTRYTDPRTEGIIENIQSRGRAAFMRSGETLDFLVGDSA